MAKLTSLPLVFAAVLGFAGTAFAQTLIVDRGLPTANLNAADATRSNAAWRSNNTPTLGYDAFVLADRFNVGDPFAGQTVSIKQISVWVVKSAEQTFANFDFTAASSYSLLLSNLSTGSFLVDTLVSPQTPVSVNYSNGQDYLTPSGSQIDLLRLDFLVDVVVAPGSTLFFGVAGFDNQGVFLAPALHASNSALSGSPQQGSDGTIYLFGSASPYLSYDPLAAFSTANTFWNKSSDFNVQVFASAVPEPSTYGLIGAAGLVGLVALRRRTRGPRAG